MRLPLQLKLGKKSGRYVLSRDLYVLTVYLGEEQLLQCTLNTYSTGHHCIDYLAQRLDLRQVSFFGLRFWALTSNPDCRPLRWVELHKPLRRQLDKWASKQRQCQLAVIFHTPNALSIVDPVARSYYFLLMKSDVIEGRLTVEMDKAIDLAAYSLQEYGDYDCDVHTIEFLQCSPLLPKHIARSAQILEDLLRRVASYHERLKGMQPSHVALLYITEARQCEGYGEEFLPARDEDSIEVNVGYGQDGIVVDRKHGPPLKYRWDEIHEIRASKRILVIKCQEMNAVHFVMEDLEMAKYCAALFTWQLNYFMNYPDSASVKNLSLSIDDEKLLIPSQSHSSSDIHDETRLISAMNQYHQQQQHNHHLMLGNNHVNSTSLKHLAVPSVPLPQSPQSPSHPLNTFVTSPLPFAPAYRPAPDYQTALKQPTFDQYRLMVTARKRQLNAGSSPEIHMLGTRGVKAGGDGHDDYGPHDTPISSSDLFTNKWKSTPDLNFSARNDTGCSVQIFAENARNADLHVTSVVVDADLRQSSSEVSVRMPDPFNRNAVLNGVIVTKIDTSSTTVRPSICSNDEILTTLRHKLLVEGEIDGEFAAIPNRRVSAGFSTSVKSECTKRNRTGLVLPYEDTRVMLRPNKANPCGYINASNIQFPLGNNLLKYIATQNPLRETVGDFWQMIWESGSQLIVMLCQSQDSKSSLLPYDWPTKSSRNKWKVGDFSVTLESFTESEHQKTSILTLKCQSNGEKRTVYHFHFHAWAYGTIPGDEDAFFNTYVNMQFWQHSGFIDAVNSVKHHLENEHRKELEVRYMNDKNAQSRSRSSSRSKFGHSSIRHRSHSMDGPPWNRRLAISRSASDQSQSTPPLVPTLQLVVHCLDGATDTGLFLLAHSMLHCLQHNYNVDLPRALTLLRQQRMCLIRNPDQYKFVYSLLVNYLHKSRLI